MKYLARSPEGVLFFTDQGVTVAVPRVGAFRMLFDGALTPEISAEQEVACAQQLSGTQKFGQSITNVENYGALRYTACLSGYRRSVLWPRDRHLEHDFVLAPEADPNQIALRFEGIDHVALAPNGSAELSRSAKLLCAKHSPSHGKT